MITIPVVGLAFFHPYESYEVLKWLCQEFPATAVVDIEEWHAG
jgi:hypothetical protein